MLIAGMHPRGGTTGHLPLHIDLKPELFYKRLLVEKTGWVAGLARESVTMLPSPEA